MEKVAVLTGGGCAPGLDPAIEAFVKRLAGKYKIIGIRYGWKSILAGKSEIVVLTPRLVDGWVRNSGTNIGTSRVTKFTEKDLSVIQQCYETLGIGGIVALGGDDTLGNALFLKSAGFRIIGVPKTMDLDLNGTDYSVGFWSYVEAARIRAEEYITTLKSHGRVGVIEVFGRDSGFTAVVLGIASGACYIAVPEIGIDYNQLIHRIEASYKMNDRRWALVVMSEAVEIVKKKGLSIGVDGHVTLKDKESGKELAVKIQTTTGYETKSTQFDHPERGRIDTFDAFIGYRLGIKAAEMVKQNIWGTMIAIHGENLEIVPLESFAGTRKIAPGTFWYDLVVGRNSGKF